MPKVNPVRSHTRAVWAEVDLDRDRREPRGRARSSRTATRVMAVLKADAYGLGAVPIARRLLAEGVAMIGVGDSSGGDRASGGGHRRPDPHPRRDRPRRGEKVVAYDIATCIHSSPARSSSTREEAARQAAPRAST